MFKVYTHSKDEDELTQKHYLVEINSQTVCFLIRRFYNLTGLLLELKDRKNSEKATFEHVFKKSSNSKNNQNKKINIRFSLNLKLVAESLHNISGMFF